jgi:pectinesterase
VVFKDCFMDSHISRYGWGSSMNGCPPSDRSCKSIRFAEFNSTGPGADAQARAKWSRQLTPAQAAALTPTAVLRGWTPSVEVF